MRRWGGGGGGGGQKINCVEGKTKEKRISGGRSSIPLKKISDPTANDKRK